MLRFTDEHEWIRLEGDIATIGITTHAAEQLGDLVFIELPKVGAKLKKGEAAAVVESVKAASDVYAPAERRSHRAQCSGRGESGRRRRPIRRARAGFTRSGSTTPRPWTA